MGGPQLVLLLLPAAKRLGTALRSLPACSLTSRIPWLTPCRVQLTRDARPRQRQLGEPQEGDHRHAQHAGPRGHLERTGNVVGHHCRGGAGKAAQSV